MTITGAQLKFARELIGLSLPALAVIVQCSIRQIESFEAGAKFSDPELLSGLRRALETAGIVFTAGNGGEPSVKLRKPK